MIYLYELADAVRSWCEVRTELLSPHEVAARRVAVRFLAVFDAEEAALQFRDMLDPATEG